MSDHSILPSLLRRRAKSLNQQKKNNVQVYSGGSKAKRLMSVDFDYELKNSEENSCERAVYTLVVRICEARLYKTDLVRDSLFVTLDVDGIHNRTRSVVKSENPLWVEQFSMKLRNPEISVVHVTIWYEHSMKEYAIGKCDIPANGIKRNTPIEQWYDVFRAASSQYVSGQIHVKINSIYSSQSRVITLWVVEGRNLPLRTLASSEVYAKVSFNKQTVKTKSVRTSDRTGGKMDDPLVLTCSEAEWNEEFDLKLAIEGESPTTLNNQILIQIYKTTITGAAEIGQVSIDYNDVANRFYDEWIDLCLCNSDSSKAAKYTSMSRDRVGVIRLYTQLNQSVIYSIQYYKELLDYLLESEQTCMSVVKILECMMVNSDNRGDLALHLINIYESKNKIAVILKTLLTNEIQNSSDVETLFRANSLASKAVDCYMKIVGHQYLQYCVQDTVDIIYKKAGKLSFEPEKGKADRDESKYWHKLTKHMDALLFRIYASADKCPATLRDVFHHIQVETEKKFADPRVRYTSVSGFLFLRFIVAAILGPKLFNLASDYPSTKVLANLTAVSRILQKIANFTPFDFSRKGNHLEREVYIENKRELMKVFLDEICRPEVENDMFDPTPVDLPEDLAYLQYLFEQNIEKLDMLVRDAQNPIHPQVVRLVEILDRMAMATPNPRTALLVKNERSELVPNPEFRITCSGDRIGLGRYLSDDSTTGWSVLERSFDSSSTPDMMDSGLSVSSIPSVPRDWPGAVTERGTSVNRSDAPQVAFNVQSPLKNVGHAPIQCKDGSYRHSAFIDQSHATSDSRSQ
ncbi:rasGAP-activating-like protein 1 isoform X2 [Schistocerca gregaria]|uniref:rasGAP-activating-like protein 1 isoform X2 n=1 Tax=Schistocerca gregaria TaxID=7010 RepID=UPI00211E658F|nr:rasGAP-activating-like protein 1 isoform X2 [Schistocerca gregaria]